MEKIIMVIEKSKDFFDAYSDNCDGIWAAGGSIEEVKKDASRVHVGPKICKYFARSCA